jgi:hypothetical protein
LLFFIVVVAFFMMIAAPRLGVDITRHRDRAG